MELFIGVECSGIISVFVDNIFKTNITVFDELKLEDINVGEHNITVVYNGDEYFSPSDYSNKLTISKANPFIKINSSNLAGIVSFDIILNEKTTGNITINFNNNSYSGSLKEGKTNILIPNLIAGDYNCTINYVGDSNYNSLSQYYNFSLLLKKSDIAIDIHNITSGEYINVQYNLTNNATGNISLYINNTFIKNYTSKENISIENLAAGIYIAKIIYNGDEYYAPCENISTFKVYEKTNISIQINNITFDESININPQVSENATGTIVVYLDSILKNTIDVNKHLDLFDLNAGNHTLRLVYCGDDYYAPCEYNTTFEVFKANTTIIGKNINSTAGNVSFEINMHKSDVTGCYITYK